MEIKQLEYFKAIAELGSLAKATEELYISQSALSKSIAKLEEELGVLLFSHNKNKIVLNEMGRKILPYAQKI